MLPISVLCIEFAEFIDYVFAYFGMHVSTKYENVVLQDTIHKGGYLIIEGDETHFFSNIGWAVAGDDCCAGVAIKRKYHHPWLYFLCAIS